MAIVELSVAGYRSIRSVRLPFQRINVLVGPNGCGKSNLYRSMLLLAAAGSGGLAQAFAEEGGMPSALWAGGRKKGPVQISLEVVLDDLAYRIACGLPVASGSAFDLDPQVKEEEIGFIDGRKRIALLERRNGSAWARDIDGRRIDYPLELLESESVLSQIREPHRYPHLSALRQELRGWRFYHEFRTDPGSPLRHPQVGVRTTALHHDGRDLAAALQTIREIGDAPGLEEGLQRAFPGARLEIESPQARFGLALEMPGFRRPQGRPFDARELSDGTLRYLCLLAALLSPRSPSVLALNEPETSIHPDLLDPLAETIVRASRRSQLWITTHSEALADGIARLSGTQAIRMEKVNGETRIAGQRLGEDDDEGIEGGLP